MSKRASKHWSQDFSDEPRSDQPHVLDDETLKAAIEEDVLNPSRFLIKP